MGRKKRRWRKWKQRHAEVSMGKLVAWADWVEETAHES
jgi:hypothetical protein